MINQLVRRSFAVNGRSKLSVAANSTRPSASVLVSPMLQSTEHTYCSSLSTQYRYNTGGASFQDKTSGNAYALTAATFAAAASGLLLGDRYTSKCEAAKTTDCTTENNDEKEEDLPIYTMEQVSQNNGKIGSRVWMTYGGNV